MQVSLELFELRKLLAETAEIAVNKALTAAGMISPVLSATQAHKLYGRKTVERWVAEGLITPHKDGQRNSAVRFNAIELQTLAVSSNRASYFLNLEKLEGA